MDVRGDPCPVTSSPGVTGRVGVGVMGLRVGAKVCGLSGPVAGL